MLERIGIWRKGGLGHGEGKKFYGCCGQYGIRVMSPAALREKRFKQREEAAGNNHRWAIRHRFKIQYVCDYHIQSLTGKLEDDRSL